MLKNCKRKGSKAELKVIRVLEAAGYYCTKSGGSLGVFDIIALGRTNVRCIQVKSGGARLSGIEREKIQEMELPPGVSREYWRYPDYARKPLIEYL